MNIIIFTIAGVIFFNEMYRIYIRKLNEGNVGYLNVFVCILVGIFALAYYFLQLKIFAIFILLLIVVLGMENTKKDEDNLLRAIGIIAGTLSVGYLITELQ